MDKESIIKSLLHTLEVAIAGGAALFIVYLFRDDADIMNALKDALLNVIPVAVGAGLAKFNRASPLTKMPDYINQR